MRTVLALLLTCSLTLAGMAQAGKGAITPTPDPNAPSKVYVPEDLEDALVELGKMLSPALQNEMRRGTEREMVLYHRSVGTWLRDNWGLWAGSRLARYFNRLGIEHPDDMSGIILTSFWRRLHSRPVELAGQVQYYKDYWREEAEKEEAVTPVPAGAMRHALRSYDGGAVRLADYAGKRVVVLGWWYMLCKPSEPGCELLSHLVRLKREYGGRGLEVIGMPGIHPFDPARAAATVKGVVEQYGVNFPLVRDDDTFTNDVVEYEKFGYSASPQAFVISRDGRVVKRVRGFDPRRDPEVLRGAVEGALRVAPGKS